MNPMTMKNSILAAIGSAILVGDGVEVLRHGTYVEQPPC